MATGPPVVWHCLTSRAAETPPRWGSAILTAQVHVHPLLLQAGAEADVRRLRPGAMLIDAHFLYPDGIAAIRIGRRLGLPVVLTARGSDVNVLAQQPGPRAWLRRALPQAAAVVAVS